MADSFDPYRESLIMETDTLWPEEYDSLTPQQKAQLEIKLHAEPDKATQLEYVRVHTGFCRKIIVTPADYARIAG